MSRRVIESVNTCRTLCSFSQTMQKVSDPKYLKKRIDGILLKGKIHWGGFAGGSAILQTTFGTFCTMEER